LDLRFFCYPIGYFLVASPGGEEGFEFPGVDAGESEEGLVKRAIENDRSQRCRLVPLCIYPEHVQQALCNPREMHAGFGARSWLDPEQGIGPVHQPWEVQGDGRAKNSARQQFCLHAKLDRAGFEPRRAATIVQRLPGLPAVNSIDSG
jgi:hypothetical protein